jgi:hypothetical protein
MQNLIDRDQFLCATSRRRSDAFLAPQQNTLPRHTSQHGKGVTNSA